MYKAVIAGQTNGNGYAILSDIMQNAILNARDIYLRAEVYQEAASEQNVQINMADEDIYKVENTRL